VPTLLSVNSYYYRRDGSEVVFLDHNRLFGDAGWTVVPFAMRHPENLSSEWSEYFVTEVEFGSDYSLAEKLVRVPKVIYSLEARRTIEELIRRVSPDVCHCHSIYHHLSPSILGALRRAGIPTVMTLHDLKIACPAYHMFNRDRMCEKCRGGKLHNVVRHRCIKDSYVLSLVVMTEALLHQALGSYASCVDRFVSPCRFYIDKFVEWGWPRGKFVHIPNPIDVTSYTPCYSGGPAFLYFGRLSPEKGLLTLIRAAAKGNVPVRVAGSGPQRELLEREACRVDADVVFLGHLSGPKLIEEIQACRATVLPAEWYENAPMSVLESFALGKPVIGARIGGIPELVREDSTGWLFSSGSIDELAECLRAVADLPASRVGEVGRACRELVEREYSSRLYRERIGRLYAEVGVDASATTFR
jgi:glycosyltransferase involved in cell wall biosynthesis